MIVRYRSFSWRPWGYMFAAFLVAFGAAWVVRSLQMRANYELCDSVAAHALKGPRGDRIEMDTRFCNPLAGDPGTIVIHYRSSPDSDRSVIFAYNPASAGPGSREAPWYPEIIWTEPARVLISIRRISQVQHQTDSLDGMRFSYVIGSVEHP